MIEEGRTVASAALSGRAMFAVMRRRLVHLAPGRTADAGVKQAVKHGPSEGETA